MKVDRFNENKNFKIYFKRYRGDDTNIEILRKSIRDLIEYDFLYDLYYREDEEYCFLLYAYIDDTHKEFANLHNLIHTKIYKNLLYIKNDKKTSESKYKIIDKEHIDLILSTNKFNI